MTFKTVCKLSRDGPCKEPSSSSPRKERQTVAVRGMWKRLQGETDEATEESMMRMMKVMIKVKRWRESDDVSDEVTAGGSRPSAEVELTCEEMGLVLLLF